MEVMNWLLNGIDWLLLEVIDKYKGAIIAIATVVLAIITGRYVQLTRGMLEENRQMRIEAQKPQIAIFLRPHESSNRFLVLCIKNIGRGPARDVNLTCNNDILPTLFIGYIKHDIAYFAPSQEIEDIIMDVHGQSSEVMETLVEITATYKDSMNEEYKETFPLNFDLYRGVRQMSDPLSGIHDSLQSIEQSVCSISQEIQKD